MSDEEILALVDERICRLVLDWEVDEKSLRISLSFRGFEISEVFIPLELIRS